MARQGATLLDSSTGLDLARLHAAGHGRAAACALDFPVLQAVFGLNPAD
jgi:hypothetical protein